METTIAENSRRRPVALIDVFDGSPAARAGVMPNDTISEIDNQPAAGLPLQQIIEKMRGPAGTKVQLKILRKGSDPIELSMTREIVKTRSVEGTSK